VKKKKKSEKSSVKLPSVYCLLPRLWRARVYWERRSLAPPMLVAAIHAILREWVSEQLLYPQSRRRKSCGRRLTRRRKRALPRLRKKARHPLHSHLTPLHLPLLPLPMLHLPLVLLLLLLLMPFRLRRRLALLTHLRQMRQNQRVRLQRGAKARQLPTPLRRRQRLRHPQSPKRRLPLRRRRRSGFC
jgi:hypothetical protein